MEQATTFNTTTTVGSKSSESGFRMDFWIPLDMFLAVVITAFSCFCIMCCLCLFFYLYHKKIVSKTIKHNPRPAPDGNSNNHHQTSSNKKSERVSNSTTTTNTNQYTFKLKSPTLSVGNRKNLKGTRNQKYTSINPEFDNNITNQSEFEFKQELGNIHSPGDEMQRLVSTDLDDMDVLTDIYKENIIKDDKNKTADDKFIDKNENNKTPNTNHLTVSKIQHFNKLNDTVVRMDSNQRFRRMTTHGTIVLEHRRMTQREFKANDSFKMNEVIMPYDSKHGIRRFESVPGLRMTSIPLSEMSEILLNRENSTLTIATDKQQKIVEIIEPKAKVPEISIAITTSTNDNCKSKFKPQIKRKSKPKYVNVTIIAGCQWIDKKKDKKKSGKLVLPKEFDNYELAVDYATKSKLGYYGVKFVREDDDTMIKIPFDSTMAEYTYSNDYLNKYILKNGTGIEMHEFPHFDRPLSQNSGYFIFGKKINVDVTTNMFDLHLTAFKIPKKCFVFVPPNVIHSNDYFLGKWTTLLSWDQYINHVVIDDSKVKARNNNDNYNDKNNKDDNNKGETKENTNINDDIDLNSDIVSSVNYSHEEKTDEETENLKNGLEYQQDDKIKNVFRWKFVESRDKTSKFFKQIAV